MSATLTLAGVAIRRFVRDRRALFFALALPVVVIVVVGVTVRGFGSLPVGIVGGGASPAARALTAALERSAALRLRSYPSAAAAATAVRRSEVQVAVVVPAGFAGALAGGGAVRVPVLAEPHSSTQQAALVDVQATVADFAARVQAARFATAHAGGRFPANLELAGRLAPVVPAVRITTVVADTNQQTLPEGFSYSAPTMLVLFVFLNAVAGGAAMIATRRLGCYERALAAPVAPAAVVVGELVAAFALALAQALVIVLIGAVVFGVGWGDPLAAGILVVLWSLVGAGAGVAAGTLFRTPEQAAAIGSTLGIALGMLGGCMWPLSIVTPVMRIIGHVTPQAWAVDAWTTLLARHGDVGAVAPQLGILAAFAAGFVLLAAARFRRALGEVS